MKYIIYKIQINDYIYIGSTKNFAIRKSQHKCACNNGKDVLVYRTIRENGGWECCTIVPIREIEVETKLQAHIAEEAVRVEYNAQMNTNRAYRTEDENLALIKESKERWNEANKERRNEASRNWQDANKEKHAEYQKKWREANKEKAIEATQKWREAKKAAKDLEEKPSACII